MAIFNQNRRFRLKRKETSVEYHVVEYIEREDKQGNIIHELASDKTLCCDDDIKIDDLSNVYKKVYQKENDLREAAAIVQNKEGGKDVCGNCMKRMYKTQN